MFTVLHPLGLAISYIYHVFITPRRQEIQLPPDQEYRGQYEPPGSRAANGTGAREIDEDATWG